MDSCQRPSSIPEDIFDSSLNLEETHFKDGFTGDFTDGLLDLTEKTKAWQVGLKSGFEIGEELGFYKECIDVWNYTIHLDSSCFSSRVQKSVKQMNELVLNYPFSDPKNESATDIMESLRLKFKAICATLSVKLEYSRYPKMPNVDF